jgi:protein-S-isoprenylcysteine O-methyltransferase Ste14
MINSIRNHSLYPNLLVFLQFFIIGLMVIFSKSFFSSALGLTIFTLGALLGLWALNHNQLGNFNIQPKLRQGSKLITTGIYAWVRHPMYTSVIVMMLGFLLSTPSIVEILLWVILVVVLLLKAKREESLWLEHDEAYERYKNSTKLFIPYIL